MTSTSASPNQPTASKPLFKFDDYTTAAGKPALSVRMDIRDLARMYAEHPMLTGGYEDDWVTVDQSPYFPQPIHNAEEAMQALADFQFPSDIKLSAQRAARDLVSVFEQVTRLTCVRNLTAGKLDRSKFASIARTTAAGTFDVDTVRPYRRTLPTPQDLPTIAIVASAGNAEMWNDETYIPRALTLTLSILWACETVGLNTYAALVKTHCHLASHSRQPYSEAIGGIMLAEPGTTISPKAYGVALHRDLWRYGQMTMQVADLAGHKRLAALKEGPKASAQNIGALLPCFRGGNAANWARQILGADLVISIGAVTDAADIHLESKFTVQQAVQQIAAQARRLNS